MSDAARHSRKPADLTRTRSAPRADSVSPGTGADAGAGASAGAVGRGVNLVVVLFLISLIIPSIIQVGPIRLSAYRTVLLVTTLPCLYLWITGRAGRIRFADICILMLWAWGALSYVVIHGFGATIETNGVAFIETVGAYFLARCFIRTPEAFYATIRSMFWVIMFLLPFAFYETVTSEPLILELFQLFSETTDDNAKEPRLGLTRVQGPFEHEILFGVFCGSILAMVHLVLGYGEPLFKRNLRTGLVLFTALLSLSSGPLASQAVQLMLLGWNWVLRNVRERWLILGGMAGAMFVALELVANRSTIEILISSFAFNTWTAWNRLLIWEYGSASVMNNPLFGIGNNDWVRPSWMVVSVDMFWLLPGMRNGLPAALFQMGAFWGAVLGAMMQKGLDDRLSSYRTGYVISMIGLFLAGWTVHYWNATYVTIIFLMGAGAWFADVPPQQTGSGRAPDPSPDPGPDPGPDPSSGPGPRPKDAPDLRYSRSNAGLDYSRTRKETKHARNSRGDPKSR